MCLILSHVFVFLNLQKGSYDAEKKTVTLQSKLVGNASKVLAHWIAICSLLSFIYNTFSCHSLEKNITWYRIFQGSILISHLLMNFTPRNPSLLTKVYFLYFCTPWWMLFVFMNYASIAWLVHPYPLVQSDFELLFWISVVWLHHLHTLSWAGST